MMSAHERREVDGGHLGYLVREAGEHRPPLVEVHEYVVRGRDGCQRHLGLTPMRPVPGLGEIAPAVDVGQSHCTG